MAAQTFNIVQASEVTDNTGTHLVLLITPQPTTVNGTSVASPYVMPFTIASPSPTQLSTYVYGATITLTSNV